MFRWLEAGPRPQTLRFDPLPDRRSGDPPFAPYATASSGLPVAFRAHGSCAVAGDRVVLVGVGPCTVTASQAGDAGYRPAPEVSQAFDGLHDFRGFLHPVANPPALNPVNAGRAVPIRFELGGDPGLAVIAAGFPAVRRVACDTLAPIGAIEPAAAPGRSSLHHSRGTGRYTYVWKTDRRWAGSCRELQLVLDDGELHRALFRFER